MVDYLNYNQCSVAFLSVDDCVVRVVDTKDMVSAVGSLYHSFIAALDALLFVTPRSSWCQWNYLMLLKR